jgi:hypothetical protein
MYMYIWRLYVHFLWGGFIPACIGTYMYVYACICRYLRHMPVSKSTPDWDLLECIYACIGMNLHVSYVYVYICMYWYVFVCICIYVYMCASMPFVCYIYVHFKLYMSSSRGSVAHTATYHGADGCSNPNYHKGILLQKRFPFARKIYLKHFRKESEGPQFWLELDPQTINAYMQMQTDMYKYMHIYCIYMHIHTIHTDIDPVHAYTFMHIYTHTNPANRME